MTAHTSARLRRLMPRVAFISPALLEGYESTLRINKRLEQIGRTWPRSGEKPGYIKWFSFPFLPPEGSGGKPVWVDFYVVPVLSPEFIAAIPSGRAYAWSERVAIDAIKEAECDGVELTIGWGAATKTATDHGKKFLDNNPRLPSWVSTTHGDAGTATLPIETLRRARIPPGFKAAIIGANGAIGDLLSRALPDLEPGEILLVGRKGRNDDETRNNLARLAELKSRVVHDNVKLDLDKSKACLEHGSEVVIVTTNGGMELSPEEVPEGALVLDLCTPAACNPKYDWSEQLVLTSGCAQFAEETMTMGFGDDTGVVIEDIGAGGFGPLVRGIWGCTADTIARPSFGWHGHLAGQAIALPDYHWVHERFELLRIRPQDPLMHGNSVGVDAVERWVEKFGRARSSRLGPESGNEARRSRTA